MSPGKLLKRYLTGRVMVRMRRSSIGRQAGDMDLYVTKQFEAAIGHYSKFKDFLTRFVYFSRQSLHQNGEVPLFTTYEGYLILGMPPPMSLNSL